MSLFASIRHALYAALVRFRPRARLDSPVPVRAEPASEIPAAGPAGPKQATNDSTNPGGSTAHAVEPAQSPLSARPATPHPTVVPEVPTNWAPGHLALGQFKIERQLGEGGMGRVLLARCQVTGREYALKVLRPDATIATMRGATLRELYAWNSLAPHPNLIPCRFFRSIGDQIVIFTDVAPGGTLRVRLEHKLPLADVLDVAIQVARGLEAVHACGLVHRDVKPENVLFAEDGTARVSDFGLARPAARSSDGADKASISGRTPAYCSPEQSDGRPLDGSTDVFSLGVMLLEMLMGERVWMYGPAAAALFSSDSDARAALPEPVATLVGRCLASEPPDRPVIADVRAQLEQAYLRLCGSPYPRPFVPVVTSPKSGTEASIGAMAAGVGRLAVWGPEVWSLMAIASSPSLGEREQEPDKIPLGDRTGSREAWIVAALASYERSQMLLERNAIACADGKLWCKVAEVLDEQALLRLEAGDLDRAIVDLARAAQILAEEATRDAPRWSNAVAAVHSTLAQSLYRRLQHDAAIGRLDAALKLLGGEASWLVRELKQVKANLLVDRGRNSDAATLYQELLEGATGHKRANLLSELAQSYRNSGQLEKALTKIVECVRLQEAGDANEQRSLGFALWTQGTILTDLGRHNEAVEVYDRALQAGTTPGLGGVVRDLERSRVLMSKAMSVQHCRDVSEALALLDEVIAVRQRIVQEAGHTEHAHALALAHLNKAYVLQRAGRVWDAASAYGTCIELLRTLLLSAHGYEASRDAGGAIAYKASKALRPVACAHLVELMLKAAVPWIGIHAAAKSGKIGPVFGVVIVPLMMIRRAYPPDLTASPDGLAIARALAWCHVNFLFQDGGSIPAAERLGILTETVGTLERMLAVTPRVDDARTTVGAYVQLAVLYLQGGDRERGLGSLRAAVKHGSPWIDGPSPDAAAAELVARAHFVAVSVHNFVSEDARECVEKGLDVLERAARFADKPAPWRTLARHCGQVAQGYLGRDDRRALELSTRAMEVWEQQLSQGNLIEILADFTWCRQLRIEILRKLGRTSEVRTQARAHLQLFDRHAGQVKSIAGIDQVRAALERDVNA